MWGKKHLLLLLALALLPSAAMADAPAQLPVEAFGTIPIFRSPHLSPDGSHLAAIQSYKGRPVAVIYDLKAPKGTLPAIVESDEWFVADLRWVKADALMLVIKSSQRAVDARMRTWVRSRSTASRFSFSMVRRRVAWACCCSTVGGPPCGWDFIASAWAWRACCICWLRALNRAAASL